jgi:transcriptional regulator with XRE-family HTH domain
MSRLKELREERNWTQKYIGSVLNVKNAAISKYETGRAALTEDTIILLAKLFNVSSDYLLGLSDKRTEFHPDANDSSLLDYPEPVYRNISLNETSGFPNVTKNDLNKDEANVLYYYNRLSDENKDYIKGKMIDLYREQLGSLSSSNLNPDSE